MPEKNTTPNPAVVKEALKQFTLTEENPQGLAPRPNREQKKVLLSLRNGDFGDRIALRKRVSYILLALLILQNVAVFTLVFIALFTNRLSDLQLVLSVLTTATLLETGYAIRNIVEFLFKEIPYAAK